MLALPLYAKIFIGILAVVLLFYIVHKITIFLKELFKPFKKGKKYWCRVKSISDGDTLTCYRFNVRRSETKLRFAYIDAPESSQAYGKEAHGIVTKMVGGKLVRVQITDIDRYGRCVGVIYRYRKNVNEELVRRGAAWVYEDYIKDVKRLKYMKGLQEKAKLQKKGLWRAKNPVRPSSYRKQAK